MKRNYLLIIILTIIILLCIFYVKTNREEFLDTTHEKTIYLVWRNKKNETNVGFGDKLGGVMFLYQYCKENNINLKIDATDDICGEFLKNVKSPDYNLIKDKELIIFPNSLSYEEIDKKIQYELTNNDIIYVFCVARTKDNKYNDDIEFGKYICEPTDELNNNIIKKVNELPNNFGIIHFRFDDKVFYNDVDPSDKLFKKYFSILQENYKPTDILFTNSNNFKQYAKDQLGIRTIDCDNNLCKISHIGQSSDVESVKNSFIEFFIISNSGYIKSFSCYDWQSNFVKWPAKIYDIPIESKYINESKL